MNDTRHEANIKKADILTNMGAVKALIIFIVFWIQLVKSNFTCPSEGLFADPDDCQKYFSCFNKTDGNGNVYLDYMEETCPGTLLFQEEIKDCDFNYNIDCGSRSIPYDSFDQNAIRTQFYTGSNTTVSTTFASTDKPPPSRYEEKVVGLYLRLANDNLDGYGTDSDWNPELYEYQKFSANILFFAFINPETMKVPISFQKLAATRGTGSPGAIPANTKIMFAIGGYGYSVDINPWPWLVTQAAAEAMAEQVATWFDDYVLDGVDLDIEEGAGGRPEAGPNLGHFVKRLRELRPDAIIGQPTYGYPSVQAEIDVINLSWNPGTASNDLADSVGIMVYNETQSLDYVEYYAHGSQHWRRFPIKVDVPYNAILCGAMGSASATDINTLAEESIRQNLLGIMVWYASVINGFQYGISWDTSASPESQAALAAALIMFQENS